MCQKPAESDISGATAIFFPKRLLRLELRKQHHVHKLLRMRYVHAATSHPRATH